MPWCDEARPLIVALFAAAVARPGAGAQPAHEVRVPVGGASLYAREIGRGPPMVVLHGGPDFDHTYLLPDMDRLADAYRLVYYDQRGRGKSGDGVRAEDVTLASDIADIDAVREVLPRESLTTSPRVRPKLNGIRCREIAAFPCRTRR
jgi:hypothetical protein